MAQATVGAPYRPQEVVADARPAPLRQVSLALAAAAVVMLLLTSSALERWADDLDVGTISDVVLAAASRWDQWMHEAGLAVPFDLLRDAFERFRSLG